MDPITIIGAVGSVVGIAAFGLKIAQFIGKSIDEYETADDDLSAILDVVKSTSRSLSQVELLLREEKRNLAIDGKAKLFSTTAVENIRSNADDCLMIFWRIEATLLKKDNPKDLQIYVLRKLLDWRSALARNPDENPPDLALESDQRLSRRQRFRWSSVGAKLEKYTKQLHSLQTDLILLVTVINFKVNLVRP